MMVELRWSFISTINLFATQRQSMVGKWELLCRTVRSGNQYLAYINA
jgi:hypothetical protein